MSEQFTIGTSRRFLAANPDNRKTIRVAAGGTVYYGTETVTSSSNDGSVTSGGSFTFASPKWFVSASTSRVFLEEVDEPREREFLSVKDFGALGDGTTDDTVAIQAAIDRVERLLLGGTVYLPSGLYRTSAPLTIKADNIVFFGDGPGNPGGNLSPTLSTNPLTGGSVIRPLSTFSGDQVLKVGQAGTPERTLTGVRLRDFSIDGFSLPGTTDGIFFQVFNGAMLDLHVYRCTGDGVNIDGNGSTTYPNGAWDNQIRGVKSNTSGGNGFSFTGYATDHTMVGCTAEYSTGHGFYFDANSSANMLTSCYSYNNTGNGILSETLHQQKFYNTRVQDCNGGIYMTSVGAGTGGSVITGCTVRNASVAADDTTDGINITPGGLTRGTLVAANTFYTDNGNGNGGAAGAKNRARYNINLSGNCNGFTVVGNDYGYNSAQATGAYGTNPINDGGANTRLFGVTGADNAMEWRLGNTVRVLSHSGSPEGVYTAGIGSLYLRTDGGANTSIYVKESGVSNTGWIAK